MVFSSDGGHSGKRSLECLLIMFIIICVLADKLSARQHIAFSPLCGTVLAHSNYFEIVDRVGVFQIMFFCLALSSASRGGVGREDPANRDRVPAS